MTQTCFIFEPPKPGKLFRLKGNFPGSEHYPSTECPFISLWNHDFITIGWKAECKELRCFPDSPPLFYLGVTLLKERTFTLPERAMQFYTHHNSYWMVKFLMGDKIWAFLIPEEDKFEQYFKEAVGP